MGMSVCHRALAVNPQDADSVDNPKENLSFGDTAGCRIPAVALLPSAKRTNICDFFGSCVMTPSETAEVFRVSFHLSSCQKKGVISGNHRLREKEKN